MGFVAVGRAVRTNEDRRLRPSGEIDLPDIADERVVRDCGRTSRRFGFWAVGFALLALTAFSTAPSPLYGLYQQRDNLSSLTITVVYSVYAAGNSCKPFVGWARLGLVRPPNCTDPGSVRRSPCCRLVLCVDLTGRDSWSPGFSPVSHWVRR